MSGIEGYRWVSNENLEVRTKILKWNPSFIVGGPKPGKYSVEELQAMGLRGIYKPVEETPGGTNTLQLDENTPAKR